MRQAGHVAGTVLAPALELRCKRCPGCKRWPGWTRVLQVCRPLLLNGLLLHPALLQHATCLAGQRLCWWACPCSVTALADSSLQACLCLGCASSNRLHHVPLVVLLAAGMDKPAAGEAKDGA